MCLRSPPRRPSSTGSRTSLPEGLKTDDDIDARIAAIRVIVPDLLLPRANLEADPYASVPSGHRAAILAWFSRRTEVEAGDIVFTYGYPLGFGQASFGDFAVTRHVVAGVDGGDLLDAGGNRFRFTHDSDVEFYMERTPGFAEPTIIDSWIVDHMSPEVPDSILINTGSPSAPQASVNLQQSGSGSDAFVDVQTGLFQ